MPGQSPETIPDSQGTEFKFDGVSFIAKNVKVKTARPTVEVTSLAVPAGGARVFQAAPLPDATTITLEYFSDVAPTIGTKATIVCESLGVMEASSVKAFCEDFELTAAVGELIMGTATFKITNDDVDLKTPS
jgi:hypothetical protein